MARLILATPDGQQVVDLREFNSLGRHPSNTIQLLDKIVSKEHCTVERRGDGFILRDLGSLNGTYVNGERVVGEIPLTHGADIALGGTRARYDDGSGNIRPPEESAQENAWERAAAPSVSPAPPSPAQPAVPPGPFSAGAPATPSSPPAAGFNPYQYAGVPSQAVPSHVGPKIPPMNSTRVDISDQQRAIGTQIAADHKGFVAYDQLASNPQQLAADYERLRLSHELSREIAMERDLATLLNKILLSVFRFVRADRGVIFLRDSDGELQPGASLRRDGTDAPITVSTTIMEHVVKERATVLTHDAAMDFAASKGKSMILNRISSAIVAPLLHDDNIVGVLWLDSETLAQFQQKDLEIVTSIAGQAAMFIQINILGVQVEREIVNRERFSRLLSPNVAEKVLSGELEVKKGGQLKQRVTVFNSDIRGFTRMSEGAQPEVIVEMLNEYFEHMTETLFKYEGTLDKFMGDGIMALWGAPAEHKDDAIRCVACALEQMEVLGKFNRKRMENDLPPLAVGIGIHTGPLVAGYIGSSKALSYTVIGDTANTSARLCGIAAGGQILVSEATLAQLRNQFEYKELPAASLKGKTKPFKMYDIIGRRAQAQVPVQVG